MRKIDIENAILALEIRIRIEGIGYTRSGAKRRLDVIDMSAKVQWDNEMNLDYNLLSSQNIENNQLIGIPQVIRDT